MDFLVQLAGMSPGAKVIVALVLALGVMCQRYLASLSRKADELKAAVDALNASDVALAQLVATMQDWVRAFPPQGRR